jgi:hypothetical protein
MRVRGAVFGLRGDTAAFDDPACMLSLIVGRIDDAYVHDLALLEPATDPHGEARSVDTVDARGVELMCDTQDSAVWMCIGPDEQVIAQQFLVGLPDDASVDRGEHSGVDAHEKALDRIDELLERRDRRSGE